MSVFIGSIEYFGTHFSLYWIVFWFDFLMHFLGGAWIALITYILFSYAEKERNTAIPPLVLCIAMMVILVGVMWEWLEINNGLSQLEKNYFIDTLSDFVFDVTGASALYLFISKKANFIKIK